MKISGFTIVRNGQKFDYPYLESIASLLPLVDELIVGVGKGDPDDQTLNTIRSTFSDPKIKIVESEWPWHDLEKRRGGQILADETNRALAHCTGDWCVYLQADELLHESSIALLRTTMTRYWLDARVEALVFPYIHFYGNYNTIQQTRSAYRREVRAFKRSSSAQSVGDAQSFRRPGGEKLKGVLVPTPIYHYGWVRTPEAMRIKTEYMDSLYHLSPAATGDNYRYKRFWGLREFRDSHPKVMASRISKKNWNWDWKHAPWVWSWKKDLKKVFSDAIEHVTDWRPFEYRAYRLVGPSEPRAALVITTYNDPKALAICLESLLHQSSQGFDIWVADDGSTDGTRALIDAYRPLFLVQNIRLTHQWHPDLGYRKSTINNLVFADLQPETYPITICVDGDTFVNRHFIKDHKRMHRRKSNVLFMGRRLDLGPVCTKEVRPATVAGFGLWQLLFKHALTQDTQRPLRAIRIGSEPLRKLAGRQRVRDLLGSNFSISTRLLHSINGYNESYRSYWGEDGDLYVRARNIGSTLVGSKNFAVQYHMDHPRREPTAEHQTRYAQILLRSDYVRCEQGIYPLNSNQNHGPLEGSHQTQPAHPQL